MRRSKKKEQVGREHGRLPIFTELTEESNHWAVRFDFAETAKYYEHRSENTSWRYETMTLSGGWVNAKN